jgi:hypothetical protein
MEHKEVLIRGIKYFNGKKGRKVEPDGISLLLTQGIHSSPESG